MSKKMFPGLKQIVLLICVSMFMLTAVQAESEMAPNFTLKSRAGKNIKLSELRGQVVMINFWASWCGPCRKEMPLLEKLYKKYKSLGFVILGVNVDDKPKQAESLLKQIDISFPILFDSDKKISAKYKVTAMPSSFFIDRDGKLRSEHKGYLPEYELLYKNEIKKLIRE
ncbi:Thiol:disulfide oxidoreductase related to ResA [hydrothermal vent metagenome]|uniref:Thiol:disulfide oxidoreductase related to ResA n=1 Tax=hydrothermal vent metagenome TaxID=652676 RepID=A0A3B1B8P1_9ZZZZ